MSTKKASTTYGLQGRFEAWGTCRQAEPGFMNQLRLADDPIGKTAREKLESSRSRRRLCPADGYPLKLRHHDRAREEVTVVCPKCGEVQVWGRKSRHYWRALETMEREVARAEGLG